MSECALRRGTLEADTAKVKKISGHRHTGDNGGRLGGMWLQAKDSRDCQQPQKLGRARKGPFLEPQRPCPF